MERAGPEVRVFFNGAEFPHAIDQSAVFLHVSADERPSVTITVFAERVDLVDSVARRVDEDRKAAARAYLASKAPGARAAS
ncbi:hypothetical protein [Allonocardiopsis opalescens]|uniref:hypothetical protein n=1 Tax=Allonocardiopsis opalescens TaxID=1144618 RepID=UPI0011B268E9|nr:hypothetical protein [Allonocardiopsis opalescens]